MPGRAGDFGQPIPGYEVLELLGSGGMSSVYKARQRGLDRYVALKVIRVDHLDPRLALARLTKEAQVLARLDHPGIVRSIDFGETGELVWFVMELVEGRSCKELLNERGKLPLREVLEIGERVTAALDHAARHGVVHRDVKPGNILLARDGAVKLTDFGLARATSDRSLTKIGITVGTPQYMSPEQVKSPRRVDLRSDFYSLGATLYHLATGRPPFGGETVGETLHEVLYGRPIPVEQVDPTLPPAFSRLLARLLARDPRRRYASGAELLADMARVRASADGGAAAGDIGLSWQDAGEPPPFRWVPWTLVAAGVVVAVAAGASLLHSGRGEKPRDVAAAEQRLLDEYRDALANDARPAVAIAADLARLKEEGTFTAESASARVDLAAQALDRFSGEVERAAREATAAALAVLARGDFAGARRAFDDAFTAVRDRLVPAALRATLPQALRDFDEVLRRAAANGLAPLDRAADAVARKVRGALRETRDRTKTRLDEALEKTDFAAAQEAIRGHAAAERDACAAATREALAASGVVVEAGATADALVRGWPESVTAEVQREPVESDVDRWGLDLANALDHCRREALDRIADARNNDLLDLGDAARGAGDGPGDDRDDAARRKAALGTQIAPRRAALAAVGSAAPAVAEIDAALADHGRALDQVVETRRARRAEEARSLLLEGDGEHPGLDDLLADRRLADARARVAAAVALSDDDRARWSGVVDSLEKLLVAAGAALQAKVGTTVDLRDRRGLPFGGKLVDEGGGQYRVDKLGGLKVKVTDLRVDSLFTLLPAGAVAERDRLLASWYFADAKSRGGFDEALAAAGDDPVVAHLRALRDDERAGAAKKEEKREAAADAALKEFQDALAKGDAARAQTAWSQLDRLRGTKAARQAWAGREKNERALEATRARARRAARLLAIAPHASERVDDPEAGVAIGYDFADLDQGAEWMLAGNDVRIENGRLHFSGGAAGRRARLYGPFLRVPFDRKFPARLELDLTPSTESPGEPSFIGLRLGGVCVVFARSAAAVREESRPQLAIWFGSLDEQGDNHLYLAELGLTQATQARSVEVGLERGVRSQVEIRWLPRPDGGSGEVEVWVDHALVHKASGPMATSPEKDGIELRSATALDVEQLRFTGRIRE
jgi:tRNA A-37 threonylcarbamoyl transferase component Bud32